MADEQGGVRGSSTEEMGGVNCSWGVLSEPGQEGDQPPTPLISSAALLSSLFVTPLFSRDLIMADSLAMRTDPICLWDGLKTGTSPVCKRKGVSGGWTREAERDSGRKDEETKKWGAAEWRVCKRDNWRESVCAHRSCNRGVEHRAWGTRLLLLLQMVWETLPADLCFVIVSVCVYMCVSHPCLHAAICLFSLSNVS